MTINKQSVEELVVDICSDTFNMDVKLAAPSQSVQEHSKTAAIKIKGDWQGEVYFSCTDDYLKQLAAALHELHGVEISEEYYDDMLCEMTNVVGGAIKSLMDGECQLSTPNYPVQAPSQDQVEFATMIECHGQLAYLQVVAH